MLMHAHAFETSSTFAGIQKNDYSQIYICIVELVSYISV